MIADLRLPQRYLISSCPTALPALPAALAALAATVPTILPNSLGLVASRFEELGNCQVAYAISPAGEARGIQLYAAEQNYGVTEG